MVIKEQTEPYQRKVRAQRRKNRKMYTKVRGHKNPKTGKPFVVPALPTGTSAPPMEEEVDYPSWTIEENPGYELTQRELQANLNKRLKEQDDPAGKPDPDRQYEIDLRLKVLKAVTTKGVIESEIRSLPGVTIVATHGDPRAKFFMSKTAEEEKYSFAIVTVRYYPRLPVTGRVTPDQYKSQLIKQISKIKIGNQRALAPGIGAHGGVKILSITRKL